MSNNIILENNTELQEVVIKSTNESITVKYSDIGSLAHNLEQILRVQKALGNYKEF